MGQQITSAQVRMARAGLQLTVWDLAEASGLGWATISRLERGLPVSDETLRLAAAALEKKGAIFIATGEDSMTGGAGVRFRTSL